MDTDLLAATLSEQVDPQRITQLTLDMVRIPSPPGQERAVSEFYAQALREIGLDVELDEEFADSPSVVARLRGRGGAPTLQLDGHTDTIDPARPSGPLRGWLHPRARLGGHESIAGRHGRSGPHCLRRRHPARGRPVAHCAWPSRERN